MWRDWYICLLQVQICLLYVQKISKVYIGKSSDLPLLLRAYYFLIASFKEPLHWISYIVKIALMTSDNYLQNLLEILIASGIILFKSIQASWFNQPQTWKILNSFKDVYQPIVEIISIMGNTRSDTRNWRVVILISPIPPPCLWHHTLRKTHISAMMSWTVENKAVSIESGTFDRNPKVVSYICLIQI